MKTKTQKKHHLRKVILVILCVFLIIVALNLKYLIRVYNGIILFEPLKISNNFRNMDQRFPSKQVSIGDEVFTLEKALSNLPETYLYLGETRRVDAFIEDTGTTGLIVAKGNTIIFESYYDGYKENDRMICWSVSKSLISALIGIAIEEGHIKDTEDYVTDYVPSLIESGYNEVSIKDVLQMSSGIGFNEDYFDTNSDVNRMGAISIGLGSTLESLIVGLEREREPGTYNRYVSSDTQVLGMVLRAATGVDISVYTQEKLWKPAGMEFDAYWLTDSSGMESAFGGFNASIRDLARFGLLYLNDGYLMNQQIIPKTWIEDSLNTDEPHLKPGNNPNSDWVLGYGYQWWIPEGTENDFLAMGIYGQAIYVNPTHEIVIVKTSAYKDYDENAEQMELESIAFFRQIASELGKNK